MASSTDATAEAQRQALARMLGRFTADRDALLAAVEACRADLETLAARVAALEAGLAGRSRRDRDR